jgi:hypothetical protein
MTNLNLQQVMVFQNDEHRFVHIGVFNMYDKLGRPNYGAQLSSHIRNAMRIKEIAPLPGRPSADVSFGNAFNVRLMNTDGQGWQTSYHAENLSVFDAQSIAAEIAERYEAAGYSFTGSLGNKAVRHFGVKGITNVVIKNAKMDRIYRIAAKLVEGIVGANVSKVQRDIYKQYAFHGLDTRRKFWNFIHANIDRYVDQN